MFRQLDRGRETLMDIFHRHQQAGEHSAASVVLERALQVPTYRPDALVWKGIAALPQTPELAFLFFAEAAEALPERADIHALVGRSLMAQDHSSLATRYLTDAWKTDPDNLALRLTLWNARSRSETPTELRRMIIAHLPDIHGGKELELVLKLLTDQADAPLCIGVVRYMSELKEVQGWAIDLQNPQMPVTISIDIDGTRFNMVASAIHPLLKAAGLPETHGGIRISVPKPIQALHLGFADGTSLLGSPVYAMPEFIPPTPISSVGGRKSLVDVLIPVYNGLDETLECINSVLGARKLNRTPHRVVVIEDKTPLPALAKALKVLAAKGKITLVNNTVNLGFIRSMNRAMALSPNKDVVWLNADTRVHGAWLDRLHLVAYSASDIASVTPFTNNGELMSFPRSQICHEMPDAKAHAALDEMAKQVGSAPIEIETGCGFCLYIKRIALDTVGYLDEVHLARGYGEETDWCLRARGQGWRHMGAPNVFVAHRGGISFGSEKILRVAQNNALLRRRYPKAQNDYKIFTLRDPIHSSREALQRARLARLKALSPAARAACWPIDLGESFEKTLTPVNTAQAKFENKNSQMQIFDSALHIHNGSHRDTAFSLAWQNKFGETLVTLQAPLAPLPLILDFNLPGELEDLVEALLLLPINHIAYQQLEKIPITLCSLPEKLSKPYSIICIDDQLLLQHDTYDWRRFARGAHSLYLPWLALSAAYHEACPGSKLQIAESEFRPALKTDKAQIFLIGDRLNDRNIVERWLELARKISQKRLPFNLLVNSGSPWLKELQATGVIYKLSIPKNFSIADHAQASRLDGVISLDENPKASWIASTLSTETCAPLFAYPSAVAIEAGARPLTSLPFSLK